MDVLVMENCFYDRHLYRIYDLKGSERNRFNEAAAANPNVSRGDVWEKCGQGRVPMQGGYRVNRLPCKLLPWTRQG